MPPDRWMKRFYEKARKAGGKIDPADQKKQTKKNLRRLEKLVDEGLATKYIIDTNSPACFEYTGADSHAHGDACYHLKCEKCGRLIHLSCDEMGCMGSHLLTEHGFKLDPRRTVFYGLCSECM